MSTRLKTNNGIKLDAKGSNRLFACLTPPQKATPALIALMAIEKNRPTSQSSCRLSTLSQLSESDQRLKLC